MRRPNWVGITAILTVILALLLALNKAIEKDSKTLHDVVHNPAFKYSQEAQDQCFCQLKGHVDDCSCNVNTVDYFNNKKIFPRLQSLLHKDFFRYFEYNPNKKCRYFDDSIMSNDKCMSASCGVQNCNEDDLPPGLKGDNNKNDDVAMESYSVADNVDSSLTEGEKKDIASWKDFDANNDDGFCDVDGGNNCKGCVHVDLTKNPERYTGYNGEAAHKIWRKIYAENCFRPPGSVLNKDSRSPTSDIHKTPFASYGTGKQKAKPKMFLKYFVPEEELGELCIEKRAFYRAISGLHASITIHLSSRYPKKLMKGSTKQPHILSSTPFTSSSSKPSNPEEFGANLELFLNRFDPDKTGGQGPFWLKNLYFVYLLELRSLLKAKPFLESHTFFTGNEEEDKETAIAVKELLNIVESFPDHYDETRLFSTIDGESSEESNQHLKAEFKLHFRNVSRVMDCVSCNKCKLWGKLQTTGLGTALKILFTDGQPKLSRNEVVALFNAFGRISTSIQQLETFRERLRIMADDDEKPRTSKGFPTQFP